MSIFIRLAFAGLVGVLCFSSATAQTVVSSNLLLVDPGSGHMAKLQVPALTGPLTYNLPNSNGTLLITNGSGVSSGWLLGGNDLSSAGPSDNKLGTSTTQDLILIAGNDGRMQLSNATSNVTLLDGTKLSFEETGGSNVSTFVAGAQGNDINYTLPTTTPAINEVLVATAVTGNDVTLGWVAGGGGGSVTTATLASDFTVTDNTTETDVTGLSIALSANTTYEFSAVIVLDELAGSDRDLRIILRGPSGCYAWVRELDANGSTGSSISTGDNRDFKADGTIFFHGVIRTFGTADDIKLTARLVSDNSDTDSWNIKTGSFISIKPF